MDAFSIDHVTIQVPDDRVDEAVAFYRDGLGFEMEDLAAYREGDRPLFSARLSESAVIHVRPIPPTEFEPPSGNDYDHFAILLDADIDEVRSTLEAADIEVRRSSRPLGATGRDPAVWVADPFGYVMELKAGGET
jgi:catechol 2,3-dioxygenase-like lactoylglutathione lyase family enzyme